MSLNAIRQIQAFNAGRDPERLILKYRAMRASPFAFLRGTCHLFYARLPRGGGFKSTPLVWSCGDLHLQNFGSYKGDNRLVYFDINDFDEAVLAPASFDLVRLLTSLRIGAGELGVSEPQAQALCEALLAAYGTALSNGKSYWVERETAQGPVRHLLDGLRERPRADFLNARTTRKRNQRRLLVDGKKALPASDAQRAAVGGFMQDFAKKQPQHQPQLQLQPQPQLQPHPDFYAVLDVARRIAGTGSLGVERYAILVQGKGSPDGQYILDLKRALPSSLASSLASSSLTKLNVPQPNWASEAHRIVGVQRRMQAMPVAFLQPVSFDGNPFVLRALQPAEDRLSLHAAPAGTEALDKVVPTLASVLAWAQLRSAGREGSADADALIAFGQRRKWQARLLDASRACAAQVARDAADFNQAWDDGAFDI